MAKKKATLLDDDLTSHVDLLPVHSIENSTVDWPPIYSRNII
jgi:hypothetical protein